MPSGWFKTRVMGQNFITADREQVLLMPPALVDWLPDEHFVWTGLDAVEQMDLAMRIVFCNLADPDKL